VASEKQHAEWMAQQITALTGEPVLGSPVVFEDTSNFMYIDRGNLIKLEGELFLVRGVEKEGRFGLDEQPKFWVKRALSLASGSKHILKLACEETFRIQIGTLQVNCTRSAKKEGRILELVWGDRRFMQGRTALDSRGNLVQVIEFIDGIDLLNYIYSLRIPHEEYFQEHFPSILSRATEAFRAIQFLNDHGLCHGDIRNDHILIARQTGQFRWIDFDLTQDFTDFDLWSLGNILHCIVGKGFISFRDAIQDNRRLSGQLTGDDASVFFPHRVMNLGRVYPYIPEKLNRVLMRFSSGARTFYDSISQLVDDLSECSA
jgi:serine/threonine protein kinase